MTTLRLNLSLSEEHHAEAVSKAALLDPEGCMQVLLKKGHRTLHLGAFGCFECDLFVEDDALELAESLNSLEDFRADNSHETFLGDGLLQMKATLAGEEVHLELLYTPHLDKRFTKRTDLHRTRRDYNRAWQGLRAVLVSAMQMDSPELAAEFERRLYSLCEEWKVLGWNVSKFRQMLERLGGVQTAKALIVQKEPSAGFRKACELGRLNVTVESLVIRDPWKPLFSDHQVWNAKNKLERAGYVGWR